MGRYCAGARSAMIGLVTAIALLLAATASSCLAGSYRCTLSAGDCTIKSDNRGNQRVDVAGFGHLSNPGLPALPSRVLCIAIPPGEKAVSISVDPVTPKPLKGSHDLAAVPNSVQRDNPAPPVTPDPAVYSSDAPFPGQPARLIGQGAYRKYNLVYVQFTPVVYHPASGRLAQYRNLQLTVHHEPDDRFAPDPALASESLAEAETQAKKIIYNYSEAQSWYAGPQPQSQEGAQPGYVIITPESCREAVTPLENWETIKGKSVHVVTVESIPTYYAQWDIQRRIRKYLRSQLASWNIMYVLLVGTHDAGAPMRATNPSGDHSSYIWTDFYYADLSKDDAYTWDSDFNGYYGEWDSDWPDQVPEVAVGRIPFTNPIIVQTVCQNMVDFELSGDMSYKKNVLLPMAFSAHDTDNAVLGDLMISDFFAPRGWSYSRLYEDNIHYQTTHSYDAKLNPANMTLFWENNRYGLVAWQAHGSHEGAYYGHGPFIDTANWPNIPADSRSFVYSGSCYNGGVGSPDSLCRFALQNGVVGIIGSTDMSAYFHNWSAPTLYGDQTAEYYFCDNVTAGESVGWAQLHANYTCWTQTPSWDDASRKDCYKINLMNELYGNPAMVIAPPPALPNLQAAIPSGWQHYTVPRGSNDATPGSCWLPATLPGNQNSTYFNTAYRNAGNGVAVAHYSRIHVDGEPLVWQQSGPLSPSQMAIAQNAGPYTIRGGRHSVYYVLDTQDIVTESNKADNGGGQQCVWEPYWLANSISQPRSAPPDKDAHGSIAGTVYDNCDGFGCSIAPSGSYNWWTAIGIVPSVASADYDIRLYNSTGYVGSASGFADNYVKESAEALGKSDFVLVNCRNTGAGSYYAGVINYNDGSTDYRIERAGSMQLTARPTKLWSGYFNYGTGNVLDMFECYLTPGMWCFYLDQVSGNCNLGFSLYNQSASFARKTDALDYADNSGGGGDEFFQVNVASSGWYGLAVWKSGATDSGKSSIYRVGFGKSGAIAVTSPNGGEVWSNGETRTITWDNTGTPDATVSIQLLRSGYSPVSIATNIANTGTYSWAITGITEATNYQIKVFSASNNDTSDQTFTIQSKTITLTAPADGALWGIGDSKSITWTSKNVTGNVRIEISRDGGSSWTDLAASVANSGTYPWTVTGLASPDCRIRVSSVSEPATYDANDASFRIGDREITLRAPNGGEFWIEGESRQVVWDSQYLDGNIRIEMTRDGRVWSDLAASVADTGVYQWTVTTPTSTTCKVRVSSVLHPEATDTSQASFTIARRYIQVTSPVGGETWLNSESHPITWITHNIDSGHVNVLLSRDNGERWEEIATNIPDTGSYPWTVAGTPSTHCKVKVVSVEYPTAEGISPAVFTVGPGTIHVTSPNGGETWHCGQDAPVTWTSSNIDGTLMMEMSRNGGQDWALVATNVSNTGSLNWPVGYPASAECRIRLKSMNHPTISDASDSDFAIQGMSAPGTPTDEGVWTTGTSVAFGWTAPPDAVGGVVDYYLTIGTSSGRGDVFTGWTGDAATSKAIIGILGKTYYCRLQAKDAAGNISPWSGTSDGVTVVQFPGLSLSEAKSKGDGIAVAVAGKVVTALLGQYAYLEESTRTCGLRVNLLSISGAIGVGSVVDAAGFMATDEDGERYLEGPITLSSPGLALRALGLTCSRMGGGDWMFDSVTGAGQQGVFEGYGLNNIGLLAAAAGQVVEVDPASPPTWFKVSDGNRAVKCALPYGVTFDPAWQYVRVVGLSSCEKSGGQILPLIRVRGQSDITGSP